MHFDAFRVWGMMGNVRFWPFSSNFQRVAVAGLVCLALAGMAHAGEGERNIEIVPFHNSLIDTNLEQPAQDDSQNFKAWMPTAPNSVKPVQRAPRMANMPRPQSPNRKEQQMEDRRRNWVFATPEDENSTEKNILGLDNEDDNMTAMERYYYRLEQSGHPSAATNGVSSLGPNRFGAQTNSFLGALRPTDPGSFGETPFRDAAPDAGVFKPGAGEISATGFGNRDNKFTLTPEEVRLQTEQKTHADTVRQLWNIDQAPAATPTIAPASGPIDSAPLFGVSSPGFQAPSARLPGSPVSGGSAPVAPISEPYVAPRPAAPPHSDFAHPQPLF